MDIAFHEPLHVYELNGKKAPSVTTITKMLPKEWMGPWVAKETCIYIARRAQEERFPLNLDVFTDIVNEAKFAWKRKAKTAADFGTRAHGWCEKFIKTGEIPPNTEAPEVLNSFQLFLQWTYQNEIEWLHLEKVVGSEKLQFCGKFDAVARVNRRVTLIDFKTSAGLYDLEFGTQLAAYDLAYKEMKLDPDIDDKLILWIPKTGNEFKAHRPVEDPALYEETFLACRVLYDMLEKFKTLEEKRNVLQKATADQEVQGGGTSDRGGVREGGARGEVPLQMGGESIDPKRAA